MTSEINHVRPQSGPQQDFLKSKANIAFYGGAAGGGKTFALLLEALYHVGNPHFEAVIFRQLSTHITNAGGLWDTSFEVYPNLGAEPRVTPTRHWRFKSGAKVTFAHMMLEKDKLNFQGSQIPLLMFDELTHFTESQFFYMMSRNRSTCGVRPYIRASCNPDPDSWVKNLISWWIDQETGYPIAERSGVIRWFIRDGDNLIWADSYEEICEQQNLASAAQLLLPKSFTFVASKLEDNQILMQTDPGYYANLMNLPTVEREQLLHGNWNIRAAAGLYFKRSQVGNILQVIPSDVVEWVRGWDLAASTGEESASTASVLIGKRKNGSYIVADVINVRKQASEVRQLVKHTAQADLAKFKRVKICLPQDPGQAGKEQAQSYTKLLAGFNVKIKPESGSKESRAEPMAAQWQAGNIDILAADWNDMYFSQLESFPESKFKDMVDASSTAFMELELRNMFNIRALIS
ncbi:MAG: phage terminase large subunit [Firmicutes bacterium]|nr:phage terminase large subunit [Bacillota bacterium]